MELVNNETAEEYEPIAPVKSERITKNQNKISERVADYSENGTSKR